MRDDRMMPTTSDKIKGATESAEELPSKGGIASGRAPSGLVRVAVGPRTETAPSRNGVPILAVRKDGGRVTPDIVQRLCDEN
jgi:hypothetical protein